MEGDQQTPVRPQDPADLAERPGQFTGFQVDDRVERDGRPELAVARRALSQVTFAELHSGILPCG